MLGDEEERGGEDRGGGGDVEGVVAIATGADNIDLAILLALIDASEISVRTYKSTTVVSFRLCPSRNSRSQSSVVDLSCG